MSSVAIIDYNMGNLRSVLNAFKTVAPDQDVFVSADPEQVFAADRVVFPGQGAARDCMKSLDSSGLSEVILEAAKTKPFLGICMGMQVLMRHSQENNGVDCLNLYPGEVKAFREALGPEFGHLKIPHMGWNTVSQHKAHPLWAGIADKARFYFVHSYYVAPEDARLTVAETDYGISYTSGIAADNVFALQCHPEKSAHAGLKLLENFTRWDGQA